MADPDTNCPSTSYKSGTNHGDPDADPDAHEPENSLSSDTDSSSSSDSESSDDESDSEQDATTTKPLVGEDGETSTNSALQLTLHPAVSSGDLSLVQALKQGRCLTDKERHYLMEHSFVPHTGYNFPSRTISGSVRHFQHRWLTKYNGLVYSESTDGGFCKFCVLFARCTPTVKELGVLVTKPLTNFKKAVEKLDEHFHGKKFHKVAVEAAMAFMQVQNNRVLAINQQLSIQRRETVAQNRLRLRSIVETIIFCGRQGIPLRGHRDDHTCMDVDPLANHGNFMALLQFRIHAGDTVLSKHLRTAGGNAVYTSKTIQNEIIAICGNLIRQQILDSIKEALFFSIIADEATDVANKEQLSISIRFVCNSKPCEKFLGFLECVNGVTGEAIADTILTQLNSWQLPASLLRGQGYDGAGAMSGYIRGVAARISTHYPKALYTHCAAHRLNLCIVKCCSIREVSNMMETADSITRFFNNSPKRQLELEKWIVEVCPSEEKRHKLKEMCRTRWIERHEAFEVFVDLFLPLISCLEEISLSSSSQWNRETRHEAQSFLLALSQFSFIVSLLLTQKILAYTKGLSVKLQGRYVDVVKAH